MTARFALAVGLSLVAVPMHGAGAAPQADQLSTFFLTGIQVSFDGPNIPNRGRTHVVVNISGAGCGTVAASSWSGVLDVAAPGVPPKLPWGAQLKPGVPSRVYTWNYKDQSGAILGELQISVVLRAASPPTMAISTLPSGDITNVAIAPAVPLSVKAASSCGSGGAPPPPATKPPVPPPSCRCTNVSARIDPKSIGLYGPHVPGRFRLEAKLPWSLTCTGGPGRCEGTLRLSWASPNGGPVSIRPGDGTVHCKGKCGTPTSSGDDPPTFTIFGGAALDYRHRAGRTYRLLLTATCPRLTRHRIFTLVFNPKGFVDKKASDLDGNGRADGA